MKCFAILASLLVVANSLSLDQEFAQFKTTHNKSYKNSLEERARLAIFQNNLKKIEEHNAKFQKGETSYRLGVNKFADLTAEEFFVQMGLDKGLKIDPSCGTTYQPSSNVEVPDSMDWRQSGAVTPVKDQGSCGSCWSFSTTGSLEGQNFLKTGQLVSFSEQNLVDCAGDYGNYGCGGGLMDSAFEYIKDHGIDTEAEYPYKAADGTCKHQDGHGLEISSCVDVAAGNEEDLKSCVAAVGPVSVAIAATDNFQLYAGGVLDDADCSYYGLNHGVLAVGYGSEDGKDYWLVKNSWGDAWGEEGYIKMSRNKDNQCGISSLASFPIM